MKVALVGHHVQIFGLLSTLIKQMVMLGSLDPNFVHWPNEYWQR